jgi:hypothetical protein
MTETKKKRTIEDLWSTPPERENYVIDPESFKDEKKKVEAKAFRRSEMQANIDRGNETVVSKKADGTPVVDSGVIDVSALAEVSPKDPEQTLPEIPAPPKAPSVRESIRGAMGEEAPAPQREVASQAPAGIQKDSSFPWDRALIGATPLLVGLLTGNKLEGTQVAGNHLVKDEGDLYKRERDLNAKLAEMQAKQQGGDGGKRRFTAQTIAVDVGDGQGVMNVKATFDTFSGRYLDPSGKEIPSNFIRAGFAVNPEEDDRRLLNRHSVKKGYADYVGTNTRVDPTTGELGIVRDGRVSRIDGQHSGEYNKKQEGDVETMVGEFTKSPAYQNSVSSLELAPVVDSLLNTAQRTNNPNAIAGKSVILTMIRQAQRVGVASDRDAAAMGGTDQWAESLERIRNAVTGTGENLTIRDIQELREISEIYKKRSQDLLTDYYGQNKQAFSRRYGLTPEQIDSQLGPKVNPYIKMSSKTIKGDSLPEGIEFKGQTFYPPKKQERSTVPFEMGGKLYWTEPNLWEEVKKENPNAKRLK